MSIFEERRSDILRRMLADSVPGPLNMELPLLRFELDGDAGVANRELRGLAGWFDRPHPTGRDLRGECDFAAEKLALALVRFGEKLEPETHAAVERFFTAFDFSSIYCSENHWLLFLSSRLIASRVYPDRLFQAYGKTGRELFEEDRRRLADFLRFRARRGWGEFDSGCYMIPVWECMTLLYDYSGVPELRQLCGDMFNLLLADLLQESFDGCQGGAHGRIYPDNALDYAKCGTTFLCQLYAGTGADAVSAANYEALICSFRPDPAVAAIAAWEPERPVEIRERKHLHNICDMQPERPLDGSVRKLTFRSANFLLGSVVYQDDYPDDASRVYAFHQQHDWDLFLRGGSTRCRIFTHHPGDFGEHNYWTGDLGCRCGRFFQHRSAVLALYDIPADQPMQFIHACFPKAEFREVAETEFALFAAGPAAYAALLLPNGWSRTEEGEWAGIEVTSPGAVNAAVCEAGEAADYASFAAFREEILSNRLTFDRGARRLVYESKRCGRIGLGADGSRSVDGVPARFDWPLYDSPLIRSGWDSGVVEITVPGFPARTLDFTLPPHS